MTATPAPALTAAEQHTVDRFGIFEPEEREAALVETVARAISETRDAHYGSGFPCRCGWEAGFGEGWEKRLDHHRQQAAAAAAISAYRAAQDGGAEEAVRRAADWLCKEYGELLDGDADGPPGYWEFQARELFEALATQAGDGAR